MWNSPRASTKMGQVKERPGLGLEERGGDREDEEVVGAAGSARRGTGRRSVCGAQDHEGRMPFGSVNGGVEAWLGSQILEAEEEEVGLEGLDGLGLAAFAAANRELRCRAAISAMSRRISLSACTTQMRHGVESSAAREAEPWRRALSSSLWRRRTSWTCAAVAHLDVTATGHEPLEVGEVLAPRQVPDEDLADVAVVLVGEEELPRTDPFGGLLADEEVAVARHHFEEASRPRPRAGRESRCGGAGRRR